MDARRWAVAMMASTCIGHAAAAVKTAPQSVQDGHWTFGGRAGATQVNGVLRTELALSAEYDISDALTWRTDLSFLFLDAQDQGIFDVTVPTNMVLWPAGRQARLRPYLGPGANFTYSHLKTASAGVNALAGLQWVNANKSTFGIEGKYLIPNLGAPTPKGQFSLALTGTFQITK